MSRRALPRLALAAALVAGAARAGDAPTLTPARALASRGPLAVSFAAEPAATHWSLETGWPLPLVSRAPAGVRLDVLMLASRDRAGGATATRSLALLLDRDGAHASSWLGIAAGGAREDGEPATRLRLAAGLARALSGVQVGASVISSSVLFRDDPRWTRTVHTRYPVSFDTSGSGTWRDTTHTEFSDHTALWTTAQATLALHRGRWALETVAGLSLGEGVGARRWAQGTARLQVARRWRVLASMGERPTPSQAFDGAAHPHTMFGVQYAPWSTPGWAQPDGPPRGAALDFRTQPVDRERTLVRVRCRDASQVEIAGDFTDWAAVPMVRQTGGWWGRVIHAEPGLHRVQVRLDGGAWQPPPRLPRAEDGPAGAAGTLLLE